MRSSALRCASRCCSPTFAATSLASSIIHTNDRNRYYRHRKHDATNTSYYLRYRNQSAESPYSAASASSPPSPSARRTLATSAPFRCRSSSATYSGPALLRPCSTNSYIVPRQDLDELAQILPACLRCDTCLRFGRCAWDVLPAGAGATVRCARGGRTRCAPCCRREERDPLHVRESEHIRERDKSAWCGVRVERVVR